VLADTKLKREKINHRITQKIKNKIAGEHLKSLLLFNLTHKKK